MMKKEIVCIIVVLVLIIGISLIYVILNPYTVENNDNSDDTGYKFENSNYYLVQDTGVFKEYEFNDLISLNLYIDSLNIIYKNNELRINDNVIATNIYLYKRAAIYREAKLVLFIRQNDTRIDELVIYNLLDDSYEKRDKLNNMYLDVNDNIYFEDVGFTINTTLVDETSFIGNSNSICNINDDRVVYKYIEILFDPNSLEFFDITDLSSLDLFNYKKNNGYC